MRPKLVPVAAAAALAISLLAATGASAAVEFGDTCSGTDTAPGVYTVTTLAAPPAAIPSTAPVSGVITKVKVQIVSGFPLVVPQQVKLLRSAGGNSFTVINQTELQSGAGVTVANARMPVQVGDRLGLHTPPFTFGSETFHTFYCDEVPGSLGAAFGNVPPGATASFEPATEGRAPVAAIIEPDADNDGFGDETQDACPQSATTQAVCPPVTLSSSKQVRKGSVTIVVTSSTAAPVSVAGVVKLGKGKKARLNGGTQNLAPGVLGKFTLKFTKKVKKKLKELPPKRSLNLNVTVTGTSVSGAVTTNTLKVKLKGQAKP